MTSTIEKTDAEIKKDVLAELKYEPSVTPTDIGVLVKNGVVTLNGFVPNYGEKHDAVLAARRIIGVSAIADDIEVRSIYSQKHSDGDIAEVAARQMDWSTTIPKGSAQITVREGWITLEGQVEWWYQKDAAERAVRYLTGVKGVSNLITIKPKINAANVEVAIGAAFERNALLDAEKIHVDAVGSKVTLRGKVRNYAERDEAERVAWAAPGVFTVDNELELDWAVSFGL